MAEEAVGINAVWCVWVRRRRVRRTYNCSRIVQELASDPIPWAIRRRAAQRADVDGFVLSVLRGVGVASINPTSRTTLIVIGSTDLNFIIPP